MAHKKTSAAKGDITSILPAFCLSKCDIRHAGHVSFDTKLLQYLVDLC